MMQKFNTGCNAFTLPSIHPTMHVQGCTEDEGAQVAVAFITEPPRMNHAPEILHILLVDVHTRT